MILKRISPFASPMERIRHTSIICTDTGCHLFLGKRDKDGYGKIMIEGKRKLVHRVVFEIVFGWLPETVCHTCDMPNCFNPLHLFGGTQQDNVADMVKKGRHRIVNRSLTPEQVIEVLEPPWHYGSAIGLAKKFGVCRSTIDNIRHGVTYVKKSMNG